MTATNTALTSQQEQFLAAKQFAVVGASADPTKHGYKAVKWLLDQHKEVVPINPKSGDVLGLKCMQSLSQLPNPTETAVFVVVRPEVTLEILKAAKPLNLFSLWILPGAENDAVVKFIQSDAQLAGRCIYEHPASSLTTSAALAGPHANDATPLTPPVCSPALWENDTTSTPAAPVQLAVNTTSAASSVLHTDTSPVCSGLLDDETVSSQAPPMVQLAVESKSVASGVHTDTAPVCSGLWDEDTASTKATPVAQFAVPNTTESAPTLEDKKRLFFAAMHYAVVGASKDEKKFGFQTLKRLIDLHKNVVPVNPNATEVLGKTCIKSLSELRDPTHTAVSVVCQPKVTLAILKEAKLLNVLVLWLQPGAEDDAVVQFIEADAELKERCIYKEHPLHTAPCLLATTAHLLPPTPLAGQKHAIVSPPSTPPLTKSQKLSPESNTAHKVADHISDLGQEIPGLA
ncbi:CoA binding domain-containing protein [Mycena filopes]|nr:CoA binding domain-containing protein [Mycena filopes]